METASVITDKESMVDPFLVEALQNPRHRLTLLRMELDIRRFMQSNDQKIFEFQHFPTSYLRLAAHRVAQHYGLQTMVQDTSLDGTGNRILVIKTMESKLPAVRLSDIPAKQSDNDKSEQFKIVIRARPSKSSVGEDNDPKLKKGSMRSVEERKEEYDKARARIFNIPGESESDDLSSSASMERKSSTGVENEACKLSIVEPEENVGVKEGSSSSRVAILRDKEKDRTDPDYDRSYGRYSRNIPAQNFGFMPFNMQKMHPQFSHYDAGFGQLGLMPGAPLNYIPPSTAVMSPFCSTGLSQGVRDAPYMQWPTASLMYAHSYDQFRQGVFQAPAFQQPLSFDFSQNH